MFTNILEEKTLKLLKSFKNKSLPEKTYLAGGTAIALQLGHRSSLDLDFFSENEFNENQWLQKLEKEFNFKLLQKDWQTLTGEIENVKFSLFYYKYPLIENKVSLDNLSIASLEDLSAIKLDTLISRGTKRDLIDIYFLAQKFGLENMYSFYDQKYKNWKDREIMIKKALIYFDDAEKDIDPKMLVDFKWEKLKDFFLNQVKL